MVAQAARRGKGEPGRLPAVQPEISKKERHSQQGRKHREAVQAAFGFETDGLEQPGLDQRHDDDRNAEAGEQVGEKIEKNGHRRGDSWSYQGYFGRRGVLYNARFAPDKRKWRNW